MRGSKRDRLRSENSEDALTWNVFKSLAQAEPDFWTRDQLVRNLDVGSWYAGVRDFYFSPLITAEARRLMGVEVVRKCATALPELDHRPDGMANIKGGGVLRWADLADILTSCAREAPREQERAYAARALTWFHERGLAPE
jgi:hypothetical protein